MYLGDLSDYDLKVLLYCLLKYGRYAYETCDLTNYVLLEYLRRFSK